MPDLIDEMDAEVKTILEAGTSEDSVDEASETASRLYKKIKAHLVILHKLRRGGLKENPNILKLEEMKRSLESYHNHHLARSSFQKIERLGISNIEAQIGYLTTLNEKVKEGSSLNVKIESRLTFLEKIQSLQNRFLLNVRKIERTKDPLNRKRRLEEYRSHFLRDCERANKDGFEKEFDTQYKLWSYQFDQLKHYNENPLFSSALPNATSMDSKWKAYLMISPLEVNQKRKALFEIKTMLEAQGCKLQEKNDEKVESAASSLSDSMKYESVSEESHSDADLSASHGSGSSSYAVVSDEQDETSTSEKSKEALNVFYEEVHLKLRELDTTLRVDSVYHASLERRLHASDGFQETVHQVVRMQNVDRSNEYSDESPIKHLSEASRLEALDDLHRSFSNPGSIKGLFDAWYAEQEKHPGTPPFFTWLQIAPIYKDLTFTYGEITSPIFKSETERHKGTFVAGAYKTGGRVHYLTKEEREERKLTIANGNFINHNQALATTKENTTENFGAGSATFVVSPSGQLYIGQHILGKEYHSSLLAGGSVRCAGMIGITDGKVEWITNKTGHYRTSNAELFSELCRLHQAGLDLSNTKVRFVVSLGDKIKHEDYRFSDILDRVRQLEVMQSKDISFLMSKEGVRAIEPYLDNAADKLKIERLPSSTYIPTLEVAPREAPIVSSLKKTKEAPQGLVQERRAFFENLSKKNKP